MAGLARDAATEQLLRAQEESIARNVRAVKRVEADGKRALQKGMEAFAESTVDSFTAWFGPDFEGGGLVTDVEAYRESLRYPGAPKKTPYLLNNEFVSWEKVMGTKGQPIPIAIATYNRKLKLSQHPDQIKALLAPGADKSMTEVLQIIRKDYPRALADANLTPAAR
jgi:hypothetical protein